MDKKFLTKDEAISQFGLNPEQFDQLVDDGELRALADRGTWKFRRDEIEGLIQEGLLATGNPVGETVAEEPKLGAGPDDFSFLELDEDALSEGATIVKKSSDLPDLADIAAVPEMTEAQTTEPVAEDSSPVILEAGEAITADSDSDVKLVEQGAASQSREPAGMTDPMFAAPAANAKDAGGSDSDVRIADSGISLEAPDSAISFEASGILGGSGLRAHESGVTLRPVDSGISLEADSGLTLESSHVDSGLTLEGSAVDSGLTLESHPDSGLTLESHPDSGITLEADSGLQLGPPDSGIRLEDDSGFQLDEPGSGITAAPRAYARGDDTQPEFEIDDENFDSVADQTAMIDLDDDDALETLPPTKRPKAASLSESFDAVEEVEDLEIAEDLDASELDVDAVEEDEEFAEDVLEASEDAFSMAEAGELSEEELSGASAPVVKTVAPREPAWGIAAILPIAVIALLLAVNSLMLWDGMATMWTGETSKALSSGIIDALAGIGG